jgi:sigma-B regulation protein RsbU (phosphoserine phosphatase)
MAQPHVQVVLGDAEIPTALDAALRHVDASVSFRPFGEALRPGTSLCADAVVVVAPTNGHHSPGRMKLFFDRMADHPRATLVMHDATRTRDQFPHPPGLPVSFSCGQTEHELAVRLNTLLDMRRSVEALHQAAAQNQAARSSAARSYDRQLRMASQVQREFLPETLPRIGAASFSVVYKPAEYVSGDIYDVQRLDEDHLGMALADATGKGIPAALLTVFIKRALRGKDIHNGQYRLLEPNEVLKRLNDEILDANLTECRFVAATYAILNIRTLRLSIARGGSPYPILRRASGEARLVKPAGGVVGVLPEARFAVETIQLERGDSLLMYSDGIECMVVPHMLAHGMAGAFSRAADIFAETKKLAEATVGVGCAVDDGYAATACVAETPWTPSASASPGAPDELICETSWFRTLSQKGPQAALAEFNNRYDALRRVGHPMDDLTVLALQIDP